MFCFQVINLPGLLQTERYIRAQSAAAHHASAESDVEDVVSVRRIRQERLSNKDNLLLFHSVIDESALRRTVGGREVMHDQLRHLIAMASLPTVTLQVIPMSLGAHASMNGAFTVLSFPDPDEPEVLCVEHRGDVLLTDEPARVREAKLVSEKLLETALSPEESIRLIEKVIAALDGH